MQLWEYLLTADKESDLRDLAAAKAWLFSQWWWPKSPGDPEVPDELPWTSLAQERWARNLLALRWQARQMGKSQQFREVVQDKDAATVLRPVILDYIALMRPVPVLGFKKEDDSIYIGGTMLAPASQGNPHGTANTAMFTRDDLDFFWQVVYLSLLNEGAAPVCEKCGRPLDETTPLTERPTRRRWCGSCRYQRWKDRAGDVRAKWKADKLKQRKKQKPKSTKRRKQP
jgi:hypothetical protein